MKRHHSIIVVLLLALNAAAQTQPEMQKWLGDLDAEWQATFKREVSDPFTAELDILRIQYRASIQAGITKVSDAGDLDGALALRAEQKRFSEANEVPAQDDAAVPLPLKQLRAGWRAQIARMERDRAARAKAVQAKYDQVLAQAQTALAQRQRLDDALMVKARRDEIATAWPRPMTASTPNPSPPVVTPPGAEKTSAPPPATPIGTKPGTVMAKVEAENVVMKPLARNEIVFSKGAYRFTEVHPSFEGYQFTQSKNNTSTLRFKVLSDGLVQMALASRFFKPGKECISDKQLREKGWQKQQGVELDDNEPSYVWWVYSRQCKAGETFSYRTEKYVAPILLVK